MYRLSESIAAETRGHGVTVFAINPGLVRTALSERGLSCGEPSVEQFFKDGFANKDDIPAEAAATLVAYLASGAAHVLSGRNLNVFDDVTQMVARAAEIEEHDLYVNGHKPTLGRPLGTAALCQVRLDGAVSCQVMVDTDPRKTEGDRPRPVGFHVTDRRGGGTADDPGFGVVGLMASVASDVAGTGATMS